MALQKEVEQPDGVVTAYHRVVRVNIMTNEMNLVEVASYATSAARKRQLEFEAAQGAGGDPGTPPYIATTFHTAAYDEAMSVPKAYEYLKTLDVYSGALDV